jgi:hypothetical protein
MLKGSMRFRGSMNLGVIVSARFNIYSCIIHFWSYSNFLECILLELFEVIPSSFVLSSI